MLGDRPAAMSAARRSALPIGLGLLLVLLIGDRLRDLGRHDQLGHLGEGQLHLLCVDPLALVLRA
jgi:hypothetical protein